MKASRGSPDLGPGAEAVKEAFVAACEAAWSLDNHIKLNELLAWVDAFPPGRRTRFLQAHALRFRARLAGDDVAAAQRGLAEAVGLFRETGMPFYLAVVLLELAELLASSSPAEEFMPLVAESREIFEHLRAAPWLDRLDALGVGTVAAV